MVRRLGQEFLDHAIDALVAGVYAGDPYKLSVPQAFPKLGQLEARYGSLIKGQIFGARERKRRGEVAKDRAPKFSFDEGLQVLPDTLRERLGEAVRLNTTVTRLTQTPEGWTLDVRERGQQTRAEHSAVIYAGTAFKLAEMEVQTADAAAPRDVCRDSLPAGGQRRAGLPPRGRGASVRGIRHVDTESRGLQDPGHHLLLVAVSRTARRRGI